MPKLTHGSDLRLTPTIGPFAQATGKPIRQAMGLLAARGFNAVQLDATLPGLRPRELDNTARRDLLATAARSSLSLSGIDFFIPAEHYSDPQQLDRVAQAAEQACSLAGSLGRVPLSMNLPVAKADPSLIQSIINSAESFGIPLAIHAEADLDGLIAWLKQHAPPQVGFGIDPAALLIRDRDPATAAQSFAGQLRVARLSDASMGQADGGRQVVGAGSLQIMPYRVSVDLAPNRVGPIVLDLRGLTSPIDAMQHAKSAWDQAAVHL